MSPARWHRFGASAQTRDGDAETLTKTRTAKRAKAMKRPPARAAQLQSAQQRDAALARAGQLHNAGQLDAAASIYRELLTLQPRHDRALFLLGLVEHQRGDQAAAGALFERLLGFAPEVPEYHLWFARVLHAGGLGDAALVEARRCRQLAPQLDTAILLESQLLREQGHPHPALELLGAAVASAPHSALLHAGLGETYLQLGNFSAAEASLKRALELDARICGAWVNLGMVLDAQQRFETSRLAFDHALRLQPDNPDAHYNLGATLSHNDLLDSALPHARRAVALQPQRGKWQLALAAMLTELGECEEALSLYRRGLALCPDPFEHSSFLALQQYLPTETERCLPEARAWGERYAPTAPTSTDAEPAPARRRRGVGPLRVGYVSGDFRQHSVSYFFEPLVTAHDPRRVEVTCYANSHKRDAVTKRLAKHARMYCVADLSDIELAQQIRADGIDVLVDLAGHTLGHRLGVFALESAPVKLSYLGYPGTTGVSAIKWRITDALVDPAPMADARYSERLYRLPRTFCAFLPPTQAPEVGPLPSASSGHITFGSFNKYTKMTEPVLGLWTAVLQSVPQSRLVLQSRIFTDPLSCERVRRRFAQRGIEADRLDLLGVMPLAEHLRTYERIDIGLDTHPWNGHTTTCLALHMGVPVLTLAGSAGASRMGVSVLRAAGLKEWVAPDEVTYVQRALRFASDQPALSELRSGLRAQLQCSELCDASSLAANIEDAYFEMLRSSQ